MAVQGGRHRNWETWSSVYLGSVHEIENRYKSSGSRRLPPAAHWLCLMCSEHRGVSYGDVNHHGKMFYLLHVYKHFSKQDFVSSER